MDDGGLPPFTFRPDVNYPVSMAIWHHGLGRDTPVSGDLKGRSPAYRKAHRSAELRHYGQVDTSGRW